MSTFSMMEKLVNAISSPLVRDLLKLMRVDRPIGTWLLLWPSLWGLTAAGQGQPDWRLMAIFIVGAFVMRSAGCVANDLADRAIDPLVERTKDRPLAAGRVTVEAARLLLFILLVLALFLALQLNRLALELSVVGAFLALTYPLTKRFISVPQLYMGMAFGWGVVIAWAAARNELTATAWLFFAATVSWAAAYDTIYAMMDREDDLKIGVHSTAILFGERDVLAIGILYALTLLLLFAAGVSMGAQPPYYLALLLVQAHFSWQLYVIRNRERSVLLSTFLSNRWVGLILLLGLGLATHGGA